MDDTGIYSKMASEGTNPQPCALRADGRRTRFAKILSYITFSKHGPENSPFPNG